MDYQTAGGVYQVIDHWKRNIQNVLWDALLWDPMDVRLFRCQRTAIAVKNVTPAGVMHRGGGATSATKTEHDEVANRILTGEGARYYILSRDMGLCRRI